MVRHHSSDRPPRTVLLLPLLVALPVLALSLRHGFDGLYGQDAYAYYNYAMDQVRHNLQTFTLPAPFFWPPGYPLLIALVSFLTGVRPIAAHAVSLTAGSLTPLLVALLAHELWQSAPQKQPDEAPHSPASSHAALFAITAGLLTALTPQLWQSSAVSMSDTTALFAATLGAWALLRYKSTMRARMLTLASAAIAFALLTRMVYVALALLAAPYALFLIAQQPRRAAILHLALAATTTLLVLSPLLAALGQTAPTGDQRAFLGHVGQGWWHLRHALRNEFVTGSGHLQYPHTNALYYALAPAHRYYFTPLLAPLLLPGLWRLWKWRSTTHFLFLFGWPFMIYLLLIGYPFQNFRFALAYLPPLAILLALGLFSTARAAARLRPLPPLPPLRPLPPLLALPLVIAALWLPFSGWTLTESFIVRKQANLATVRWVQSQIPPQSQLLTFSITLTAAHYTDLDVRDLYHQSTPDLTTLLQNPQPTYLLLDITNIETQWPAHAPGRNYHFLRERYELRHIGENGPYTLFEIVSPN